MRTKPIAVFMAFGTKGDVYPIAAIAAAFASDQNQYQVSFVTHSAHQNLKGHLGAKQIVYLPISSPPVFSFHQDHDSGGSINMSFSLQKKEITTKHRQECVSVVERIYGEDPMMDGDLIFINFFALEGWSLAELFHVRCVVVAPYVVPYSEMPYNLLFPRCAAVIHHGGSGTTAAALHAGVPQVICPFILDQFYWAERMFWLGVASEPLIATSVLLDKDDDECILGAANVLLQAINNALSPQVKLRAREIANRISTEDGISTALRIVKEEIIDAKCSFIMPPHNTPQLVSASNNCVFLKEREREREMGEGRGSAIVVAMMVMVSMAVPPPRTRWAMLVDGPSTSPVGLKASASGPVTPSCSSTTQGFTIWWRWTRAVTTAAPLLPAPKFIRLGKIR